MAADLVIRYIVLFDYVIFISYPPAPWNVYRQARRRFSAQ